MIEPHLFTILGGTATQRPRSRTAAATIEATGRLRADRLKPKVQVNPNLTVALAVFAPIDFSQPHGTIARLHSSAPLTHPLDHPTLFATLLI